MNVQEQEPVRGLVLHEVEHWRLFKTAEAAVRLGAPEAVLEVSRRGARLFSANDLWSPAWWISTTIRWPFAAPGRAIVTSPEDIVKALDMAGRPRGRYGTYVYYNDNSIVFRGLLGEGSINAYNIKFKTGDDDIHINSEERLIIGVYDTVAEIMMKRAQYLSLKGVVRVIPRSDVELRLTRDGRGWWLLVAASDIWYSNPGAPGAQKTFYRIPVDVKISPDSEIVSRYPAKILNELLLPIIDDLTIEFSDETSPALHVRWSEYHRSTEFFITPV
jgi:hypothetical protein